MHIDHINGDDANDGSTWALAKKTIPTTGLTSTTVKCRKTEVEEMAVNATFVHGDSELEASSVVGMAIDEAIGNTWSSGITGVTLGTYSIRKRGSSCQQFALATSFSGGKIAWKTLPAVTDYSGMNKICLYFSGNHVANTNNINIRICLCSDANGDAIVNDLPIDTISVINTNLICMVLDNGGALGSSIQSVAIYCDNVTSAVQIRVNCIFAANEITNQTLIGSSIDDNGARCVVDYIDGATLYLGNPYIGENDLLPIQKVEPAISIATLPTNNNVTISGGWNITTDEVDGFTWFFQYHRGLTFGPASTGWVYTYRSIGVAMGSQFCNVTRSSFYDIIIIDTPTRPVMLGNDMEGVTLIGVGTSSSGITLGIMRLNGFSAYYCGSVEADSGVLAVNFMWDNMLISKSLATVAFSVPAGFTYSIIANLTIDHNRFNCYEPTVTFYNLTLSEDPPKYLASGIFINSTQLDVLTGIAGVRARYTKQINIEGDVNRHMISTYNSMASPTTREEMCWIPADGTEYPGSPGCWMVYPATPAEYTQYNYNYPHPYTLAEIAVDAMIPIIIRIRTYVKQWSSSLKPRLMLRKYVNAALNDDVFVDVEPGLSGAYGWTVTEVHVTPARKGVIKLELQHCGLNSDLLGIGEIRVIEW